MTTWHGCFEKVQEQSREVVVKIQLAIHLGIWQFAECGQNNSAEGVHAELGMVVRGRVLPLDVHFKESFVEVCTECLGEPQC